jgi:hypothetical protein
MRLTGKDVWEVGVKMGWASGTYDPSANPIAARAATMAQLLNDMLRKRENWLPKLLESEDAMRRWEATTPREHALRLYKFLNQLGYTVIGIDSAIERERKNSKTAETVSGPIRKVRP